MADAAAPSDDGLERIQTPADDQAPRTPQGELERSREELLTRHAELERRCAELERESDMKTEFVVSMSHELRTPLNAILGFSEMLKDGMLGELNERQRNSARAIFDSGMHLLSLVNDILDISRIEAGRMELELERTNVAELLDHSVAMLQTRAATHGIALEADVDLGQSAELDRRKTRQIVDNLLSNAIKFTPDGGRVVLRARRVSELSMHDLQRVGDGPLPEAASYLQIDVEDTGVGIAPEDMGKLFRPFSQLHNRLARRHEGSGLGLVLVKQLVELQGGAIAMASRVGEGTRFTVWLPFRESLAGSAFAPRT